MQRNARTQGKVICKGEEERNGIGEDGQDPDVQLHTFLCCFAF
jgi:hypothetical protein